MDILKPIRILLWRIERHKIKKQIINLGYKPIKCKCCGKEWSEYIIESPFGPVDKKILACRNCVSVYDLKRSRQLLYKSVEDFTDVVHRN